MANVVAFLISWPIYLGIPAVILYFVIKKAVKKAIKELKEESVI